MTKVGGIRKIMVLWQAVFLAASPPYLRTGVKGCSEIRRVLAKPRLILDELCRLYGKFASYLRRDLCKTRLISPRINGPNV